MFFVRNLSLFRYNLVQIIWWIILKANHISPVFFNCVDDVFINFFQLKVVCRPRSISHLSLQIGIYQQIWNPFYPESKLTVDWYVCKTWSAVVFIYLISGQDISIAFLSPSYKVKGNKLICFSISSIFINSPTSFNKSQIFS